MAEPQLLEHAGAVIRDHGIALVDDAPGKLGPVFRAQIEGDEALSRAPIREPRRAFRLRALFRRSRRNEESWHVRIGVGLHLDHLGPEPLSTDFSADYLYRTSRKRSAPIKHFIMDAKVVVGVGNIYANEALFMAGIRPDRAANKISKARYELLVDAIKQVLATAIEVGGTTLRDFVGGDGKAGYFAQSLQVYGRAGESCKRCKDQTLREIRQSNRSTVFCPSCQR